MDKPIEKGVVKVGTIKATGIKTIEVRARESISVRGLIIAEMQEAKDTYFADRYFCDKHHISNQQTNQLMRQLENQGNVERVRPQIPDAYNQLPAGRRIMNRWKE